MRNTLSYVTDILPILWKFVENKHCSAAISDSDGMVTVTLKFKGDTVQFTSGSAEILMCRLTNFLLANYP